MSGCLDCDRPCQGARCEHCSVEHAAATDHDTGECPSCGEDTVPDGVRCQDCLPNDHDLRADGGQPAEEETAGSKQCDSMACDSFDDVRAVRDPDGRLLDMCSNCRSKWPVEEVSA